MTDGEAPTVLERVFPTMFETEINHIIHVLTAKSIGEGESILLKQLMRGAQSEVPRCIKMYFRSEVERWLTEERKSFPKSTRFNYFLPEVQSLLQQMDILLFYNYRFDRADFSSILDDAVHMQFNYLCRPQWTLLRFVFDKVSHTPTKKIVFKFGYFSDYRYYSDIIKRYLTDKGLVELNIEEFRNLLIKIDVQVLKRHTNTELAELTKPIFQFVNIGDYSPESLVPIDALTVFYDDKAMTEIKERLEEERDRRSLRHLTMKQLAALITDVRGPGEVGEAAAERAGLTATGGQEVVLPKPPLPAKTPQRPSVPSTYEYDEYFEHKPPSPSGVTEAQPKTPQPVQREAKPEPPQPISGGAIDLRALIDDKKRKKFLKRIFKKDEAHFNTTIDTLNAMTSWKEASVFIDEIFIMNDVDPFSKEAIRFTDLIYSRFFPTSTESEKPPPIPPSEDE